MACSSDCYPPPQEIEKLSAEQASYQQQQGARDKVVAIEQFPRILDKAEKLVRLLERSAEENPSPEAQAAVGQMRVLLDQGRAAVKTKDTVQMAEVTRMLERLVSAS